MPAERRRICPQELLTASDVFRYFVEAESVMQGRAKFLPWEFVVWMINDRTPLAERKWAIQNYLSRRPQIGKCYKDVPYDTRDAQHPQRGLPAEWEGLCAAEPSAIRRRVCDAGRFLQPGCEKPRRSRRCMSRGESRGGRICMPG